MRPTTTVSWAGVAIARYVYRAGVRNAFLLRILKMAYAAHVLFRQNERLIFVGAVRAAWHRPVQPESHIMASAAFAITIVSALFASRIPTIARWAIATSARCV
jgi:hypothetical protein